MFANEIRKRRIQTRSYSHWRWHLDEVFVRINGETHYLWRAVDHEGEVLEVFVTKRRDRMAALKFLKRAMKRYGRPKVIVADRLRSYGAALKVIGIVEGQECGRWLNNRADNSHQPFDLLYALVIVQLDRRDLVWINVTTNPTAEWIARQITEAFPWDDAPEYLIRDRDRIYGTIVTRRLRSMGIRDKPTAPASPWQNGFAGRLIGSIRRECVDHFVVLGEAHLRRILRVYARYYNNIRTHWSLAKDAPVPRAIQQTGIITSRAILGGLHHHYVRI